MALFLLILISFPQINSFLLIKNGAVCLIVKKVYSPAAKFEPQMAIIYNCLGW